MNRYKAIIAYDGTNYVGYQVQTNGNSIQAELNKALKKMTKGMYIPVCASGRTDSGVHANGQVIHFDYPADISCEGAKRALNSLLPDDILVKEVEKVDEDFHARYTVKGKRYIYRVSNTQAIDPFKRLYTLHHPYRLDLDKMQTALNAIIGTHDFTSFCSTKTDKEDKVRTVTKAEVCRDETCHEVCFIFEGNGFLYNMIRILVGTTLQIGNGLRPVNELERLIVVKDRNEAGPTAPPQGLFLDEVFYQELDKSKLVQ